MEQLKSLQQEAQALREMASRCVEYPAFQQQVLALVKRCEELAESSGDKVELAGRPWLSSRR